MKAVFICTDKTIFDWDTCEPIKTVKYSRPKKVVVDVNMADLGRIEDYETHQISKKEFIDVYPFDHNGWGRILKGNKVVYTDCTFCRYIDPKHKYISY